MGAFGEEHQDGRESIDHQIACEPTGISLKTQEVNSTKVRTFESISTGFEPCATKFMHSSLHFGPVTNELSKGQKCISMHLLENLDITSKLVAENVTSQNQLEAIKISNNKTRIVDWYIFFGFIIGLIPAFVLITVEMMLIDYFGIISKEFAETPAKNILLVGILNLVCFTASVLLTVKLFQKLGYRHRERIVRKRFEKSYGQIKALNDSIDRSYNECEKITVLPKKYWNIQSIKKLKEYIQNKRADSLKEALNLFEDELIKMQQMQLLNGISNLQNQMVQAQWQTNRQIAWQTFLISMKR